MVSLIQAVSLMPGPFPNAAAVFPCLDVSATSDPLALSPVWQGLPSHYCLIVSPNVPVTSQS